MSTVGDDDVLRSPVPTPDSVLGERERVASALFGRPSTPKRVGRYAVEAVLGRGAMGVVYEAWDEELQRTVAVKLISRDMDIGNAEHRFRREALALAKLAHPNVVTIHEVGSHEGRLFLAMELVRGQTLDAWLAEEPRGWEAVLEVFVQAGRGLDAAHAAGLVHRDFKPANCIVGESGRVRVLDFGLARGVADLLDDEVAATAPVVSTLDVSVTRTGATVGTPAYMAPEQLRGGEVSAASDQFAFCVALYEALAGVRPFAGKSIVELHENIEAGRLQDGQGRAPAELMRVVQRGLSVSATERWPTVGELVDALEDVPQRRGRRRRLWSMAGGGALAAAVAGAAWLPEAPCGDVPTTDVWNEERRAELSRRIGSAEAWATLDSAAAAWVERWNVASLTACASARVDGRTTELTLARQRDCLARAETHLGAVFTGFERAEGLSRLLPHVVDSIPSLEDCRDTEELLRVASPAPDDEANVADAHAMLARSHAEWILGDENGALSILEHADVIIGRTDYGPIRAEIALLRGEVLRHRENQVSADSFLASFVAAEKSRSDAVAADAAIGSMALALDRGDNRDAQRWREIAAAKLDRIGAGPDRRGRFVSQLARLALAADDLELALSASEEAIALATSSAGAESLPVAQARSLHARVVERIGEPSRTREAYQLSVDALTRTLGPSHPKVAVERMNRGMSRFVSGDLRGADEDFMAAGLVLTMDTAPGLHPRLELARSQVESMSGPVSRGLVNRVRTLYDSLEQAHPDREDAAALLGSLYLRIGRASDALGLFRELYARHAGLERNPPSLLAIDENNVGECQLSLGQLDEAEQKFRASLRILQDALPENDPLLAYPLGGLGRVLTARGEQTRARLFLERALKIAETNSGDAVNLAYIRAALAIVLPDGVRKTKTREMANAAFVRLGLRSDPAASE